MSVHVESWVWKQKVGSPLRKLILVKLAQNADDEGWSWWRQRRLAEECETSRSTVQAHLKELRGMGLIQVFESTTDSGGQGSNYYRVMIPGADPDDEPPARKSGGGASPARAGSARETGGEGAREPGTLKGQKNEPSSEGEGPPPKQLDAERWEVQSSREGHGPFVANVVTRKCNCENRSANECRHLREADAAVQQAQSQRAKTYRDALWDVLVELFDLPGERQRAARGQVVTDLATWLAGSDVERTPEAWAAEVRRRFAGLVEAWGADKVTLHSLANNWATAGRAADELEKKSPTLLGEDLSAYTKGRE